MAYVVLTARRNEVIRQLRAGITAPISFHGMGHTAARMLLSSGVHPKIVSDLLGRATVGITLDVYSHVVPALHAQAAHVMDERLAAT